MQRQVLRLAQRPRHAAAVRPELPAHDRGGAGGDVWAAGRVPGALPALHDALPGRGAGESFWYFLPPLLRFLAGDTGGGGGGGGAKAAASSFAGHHDTAPLLSHRRQPAHPQNNKKNTKESLPSDPKPKDIERAQAGISRCLDACGGEYAGKVPKLKADVEAALKRI